MADKPINAGDIALAMRKRYAAPEWALFYGVANGTGARAYRWSDAIAMSLYPSRGLELHGFEIKVSRSDYRREAADPLKAESIAAYCDRWWVVTPKGLLDTENIPPNWGWLEFDGKAFRVAKPAEKLNAKALDRNFIAALLRRASEANDTRIAAGVAEKIAGAQAEIERRVEEQLKYRMREYEDLKNAVAEFEVASGLKISPWSGGAELGKAVKVVNAVGVGRVHSSAAGIAAQMRNYAERIEEVLAVAGMQAESVSHPVRSRG